MTIERMPVTVGGSELAVAVDTTPGRGRRPDLWPSIGEYPCYDPFLYHQLRRDEVRNREFRQAVSAVADGRVVLDIGTGQDLHWAVEAARVGARRVVAVEALPEAFAVARRRHRELDEADTIELRAGRSFDLGLDRRAEVCVAEQIGSIGSAEGMLAVIADARARLLTDDAPVVPYACRTLAGAVSLASVFTEGIGFCWDALPYLRQVFELYGRAFDVRLAVANVDPAAVISTHGTVESLIFSATDAPPLDGDTPARLVMQRDGHVDGLLLWINLLAGPSSTPIDSLHQKTSWIPAYLPLFDEPVPVAAGDVLDLVFHRRTSDDGVHPDYSIDADLASSLASGHHAATATSPHHGGSIGTSRLHRELWGLRCESSAHVA